MMLTFIYDPSLQDGNIVTVKGAEARHMVSVLRLKKGHLVRLIDGEGGAHICEITKSGSRTVTCRIIKSVKKSGEPSLFLTLAVGLSTGTKFNSVIEKGTEAGVSRFAPLLTEKGKVRVSDNTSLKRKMNRWRRVAEAATKQSNRSVIPCIDNPVAFNEFIELCAPEEIMLFHPDDKPVNVVTLVNSIHAGRLTLVVGPESGFSPSETAAANDKGIRCVSLGSRILRTETAGMILPALMIYYYESVKT